MALDVRKIPNSMVYALAIAHNATRRAITETQTTYPHADKTATTDASDYRNPTATTLQVTAANATNLATLRTLCRDIWQVGTAHFADGVAHKAKDTTNLWGTKPAADAPLDALQTWLNARKVALGAHFTQAGVHFTNDTTHEITSADASDQNSSNTLANEIKADLNLHIDLALGGYSLNVVDA